MKALLITLTILIYIPPTYSQFSVLHQKKFVIDVELDSVGNTVYLSGKGVFMEGSKEAGIYTFAIYSNSSDYIFIALNHHPEFSWLEKASHSFDNENFDYNPRKPGISPAFTILVGKLIDFKGKVGRKGLVEQLEVILRDLKDTGFRVLEESVFIYN